MGTCVNHHISLPAACRALGKYPEQGAIPLAYPTPTGFQLLPCKQNREFTGCLPRSHGFYPWECFCQWKEAGNKLQQYCLVSRSKSPSYRNCSPLDIFFHVQEQWHFYLLVLSFSFLHTHTYCLQFQTVSIHSIEASLTTFKDTFIKITNNEIFLLESLFAVTCSSPKVCTVFFVIILSGKWNYLKQ